ncbi:hypothetical protein M9Y10_021650 [Tritrichomonas musculus]|uniref:Small GTP-binding protein n=1 Tax=Tritrichomonas musculus TaxID=1915356 RepID=A0ABR2KQE5_9EUKA
MSVNHKIVFIGDSSVGKTSIINQYIYGSVTPDHQPTIGIDFFAKSLKIDNKSIRLQIWDTAGQEKFHSMIPMYIRTSTVAVLVYDITSKASFESLDKWLQTVFDHANPIIFIVGNKVDLQEQRAVTTEEGQKFADEHQAHFIETSARTPTNIHTLFTQIAQIELPTANAASPKAAEAPKPIEGNELAQSSEDQGNANKGGSCC